MSSFRLRSRPSQARSISRLAEKAPADPRAMMTMSAPPLVPSTDWWPRPIGAGHQQAHASLACGLRQKPGQVTGGLHLVGPEAVGRGQGVEVDLLRRAVELLEALGGELGGLGQEREDAAAVVVDHDQG